ncbi:hypothetical protein MMJ63_22400, partial [Bacillus vallismortis]|nr:hypothetical protein [Bacillus vallismortis]
PVGKVEHNIQLKPGNGGNIVRTDVKSYQVIFKQCKYFLLIINYGFTLRIFIQGNDSSAGCHIKFQLQEY